MKWMLGLARLIVGVLFIFSGLIKANDPVGLSYKMQEFFEVWNLHFMNDFALGFSVLMIAFEIIAGVAVLLGWRMRLFSWLLFLLILFFTFTTAYALFSGKIKTCGCFGDCIPLTPMQSFIKDLILLVLILFILLFNRRIRPLLGKGLSILLLLLTTLFSFGAQWWVLKHLPLVDCLPYKTGNNIPEKMKIPAGAIPDKMRIIFTYEKAGKSYDFDADSLGKIPDLDTYTYKSRKETLLEKGNAEAPIKDFALKTFSDIDSTQAVLNQEGHFLFYFILKNISPDDSWVKDFDELLKKARAKNMTVYVVTCVADNVKEVFGKKGWSDAIILRSDAVPIKTAARAHPAVYLLKKGTILGKWSYADLSAAAKALEPLPANPPPAPVLPPVELLDTPAVGADTLKR